MAAAALLAAVPADAAPRRASTQANVRDAAGDWPVASEDIVSTQVSSSRAGGQPVLRTVLTLAAAPDAATEYMLSVNAG